MPCFEGIRNWIKGSFFKKEKDVKNINGLILSDYYAFGEYEEQIYGDTYEFFNDY